VVSLLNFTILLVQSLM